jgi:hypothetical protein
MVRRRGILEAECACYTEQRLLSPKIASVAERADDYSFDASAPLLFAGRHLHRSFISRRIRRYIRLQLC